MVREIKESAAAARAEVLMPRPQSRRGGKYPPGWEGEDPLRRPGEGGREAGTYSGAPTRRAGGTYSQQDLLQGAPIPPRLLPEEVPREFR